MPMDRITRSLLEEFSTSAALTDLDEASQFEHLAAHLTIGTHVSESFDTRDVITGSGGDTGIDAIGILVNGALVTDPDLVNEYVTANNFLDAAFLFVQAARSAGFDGSKIGSLAFGVRDFFSEDHTLVRNEAVAAAAEVMEEIYKQSGKFTRGNPTCRLYYVTTGRWEEDPNLEARRKAAEKDLKDLGIFREVEFRPVDASMLQRLYNQSKNAISREFTFAEKTTLPDMPGVTEAYLGVVPALEFMSLVSDGAGGILKSIFYDNVRDWQEYNPVNSEIRETLADPIRRRRFAIMNNGITVIARSVRPTGNRMHIEDYQIVNGCQTSHVLFDQQEHLDASVSVPLRLIASQDEEVVASIVKATNRQTEVKTEQLLALSEFQRKLEAYFQTFPQSNKLYYERRSKQYNSVPGVEKTRIITPPNLIRAYASTIRGEPHRTTRSYRTLLDALGVQIFGPEDRLEPYYFAASALYRLEFYYRNATLDSRFRPARYHILYATRLLATDADPPQQTNSHDMARYGTGLADKVWDTDAADKLFRRAAEIVDTAAAGDFNRDRIRTQPFTDEVRRLCAAERRPS